MEKEKKIQTIKLTPPSYSITAELENGSKVSIPISLGDLENESMQINFNLPSHYDFRELKQSTMEIINIVAEANSGGVFRIGWYLANALKYLFRFRRKDGVKDLKKARDYIDRLINYFEREDENVD